MKLIAATRITALIALVLAMVGCASLPDDVQDKWPNATTASAATEWSRLPSRDEALPAH